MTRKQRRLTLIGAAFGVLTLAVALVLVALKDSIVFFNSPTDVAEKHIKPGVRIRIGGLVTPGSIVRGENLSVRFDVTDGKSTLAVAYQGLLPDLFREGQGVVAEGALEPSGMFKADSVLAKHDETYMPKEVADALKKQGHWKDDYEKKVGSAPQGKPRLSPRSAITPWCSRSLSRWCRPACRSSARAATTRCSWASPVRPRSRSLVSSRSRSARRRFATCARISPS